MHNIKDIRKNPEQFKKNLKKRFIELDLKDILKLDENNRKLIQEKELLEKEKKDISKSKDKSLFQKSKKISEEIINLIKDQLGLTESQYQQLIHATKGFRLRNPELHCPIVPAEMPKSKLNRNQMFKTLCDKLSA